MRIVVDAALLDLLDSGEVHKTLKHGEIEYRSRATMWFGLQPCFVDMRQGHARRLFFLVFIPSREEQSEVRDARRRGRGIGPDQGMLESIRLAITRRAEELKSVKEVNIDEKFYSLMDELDVPHADEILFAAGILPFRRRSSLNAKELANLHRAVGSVLSWATAELRERVGMEIDVEIRDFLKVHGKGGQVCPICGGQISEVAPHRTRTNFCRGCQR